jgi:hypothetical protein
VIPWLVDRLPDPWNSRLSHWQFWVAAAYFGLVVVVTWLTYVYSHQLRDESLRLASTEATAQARYHACLESIPTLKNFDTHVEGVRDLADTLVANSFAVAASTAKSDPQHAVRMENLARLVRAQAKIHALTAIPVPTPHECASDRDVQLTRG